MKRKLEVIICLFLCAYINVVRINVGAAITGTASTTPHPTKNENFTSEFPGKISLSHLEKKTQSTVSSNLDEKKQSTVSSNLDEKKQSTVSSNLDEKKQSTVSSNLESSTQLSATKTSIYETLSPTTEQRPLIVKRRPPPPKFPPVINNLTNAILTNPNITSKESEFPPGQCKKLNASILEPCDDMLYTLLNAENEERKEKEARLEAFAHRLSQGMTQNVTDIIDNLENICKGTFFVRKCYDDAKRSCRDRSKAVDMFLMNTNFFKVLDRFCNGKQPNQEMLKMVKSSNLDQCTEQGFGTLLKNEVYLTIEKLRKLNDKINQTVLQEYQENGSSNNTKEERNLKSLCLEMKSLNNELLIKLREMKSKLTCNDGAISMMLQDVFVELKAGMDEICHLPDPVTNNIKSRGSRKDKKRLTMVLFTLMHVKPEFVADEQMFETCAGSNDSNGVDILLHSSIHIRGTVDRQYVGNAAFINSVTIKLTDEESDKTLTLGKNMSALPNTFDDGETKFGSSSLQTKTNELFLKDPRSGFIVVVSLYKLNNTRTMYSLLVRGPQSMIDESSGQLIFGCSSYNDNVRDIIKPRRVKRSATITQIQNYDQQATGDSGIVGETEKIVNEIEQLPKGDNFFTSDDRHSAANFVLSKKFYLTSIAAFIILMKYPHYLGLS